MSVPATSPIRVRIDFVSDIACPWCAVGLKSLEAALARLAGELEADIHFQPFELNPQLGPEGEDAAGHLQRKYGLSAAQLAENQQRIRERGAELGFEFGERTRVHNTFDAHRLLHWAAGEGRQRALKHALLKAYFTDGRDVSDRETLVSIAGTAGLDEAAAREVLESGRFSAEVRRDETLWQARGIRSVPGIVINERHLISGGQPSEVFEQALRRIASGALG